MSNKIWNYGTCLKKDLFSTLVSILQTGGWTLLTSDPENAPKVNFKTVGELGDKTIYLQLIPFDGNVSSATFDIRKTNYTDFVLHMGIGYDSTTDTITTQGDPIIFSFISGRGPIAETRFGRMLDKEWSMHYWYYVDKDRIMFMSQPGLGATGTYGTNTAFNFIGVPEEMYLKEHASPVYSGLVSANSHCNTSQNRVRIQEKPLNSIKLNGTSYCTTTLLMSLGASPNVDNNVELSEVYITAATEGLRGKLGGFYLLPTGAILDGDTVEVLHEGAKHTYLVKILGPHHGSSLSCFPSGTALAIRIS